MKKGDFFMDENQNFWQVSQIRLHNKTALLANLDGSKGKIIPLKNHNLIPCLTAKQYALAHNCTTDNVYKTIRRGKIKAFRKYVTKKYIKKLPTTLIPQIQ